MVFIPLQLTNFLAAEDLILNLVKAEDIILNLVTAIRALMYR